MPGKHDTFENDFLKLILQAVPMANFADNAASAPNTVVWLSLHTADPGEAGNQSTNEIAYGNYARVSVPRSASGWTVTGNVAALLNDATFPTGNGGSGTATFFGIGTASSGAGKLLWSAALSPAIVCGNGATPVITTATSVTED